MTNDLTLFEQEKPVISLPLKDGTLFDVEPVFYEMCKSTYKNVNVEQELKEMCMWLISNESKQKTRRGIKKFINGWLSRSNKAPKPKVDNRESFQSLHDNVKF